MRIACAPFAASLGLILVATAPASVAQPPYDPVYASVDCAKTVLATPNALVPAAAPITNAVACQLRYHAPIQIHGDPSPVTLAQHGIIEGDGTPTNPYVISGWEITYRRTLFNQGGVNVGVWTTFGEFLDEVAGVRIEATSKCFLIRNVWIHDLSANDPDGTWGVALKNAPCVTIEAIRLERVGVGIENQGGAGALTVRGVSANFVRSGIASAGTGELLVEGNRIYSTAAGVHSRHSAATIRSNTFGTACCLQNNLRFVGIVHDPSDPDDGETTISSNSVICPSAEYGIGYGIWRPGGTSATFAGNSMWRCVALETEDPAVLQWGR